jgi:hypothetical protein
MAGLSNGGGSQFMRSIGMLPLGSEILTSRFERRRSEAG